MNYSNKFIGIYKKKTNITAEQGKHRDCRCEGTNMAYQC